MKYIRAVLYTACSLLVFAAAVIVSLDHDRGPTQVVYAVNSSGGAASAVYQGMDNCIDRMHDYNVALQTISLNRPGEQVLVGTQRISRYEVERSAFGRSAQKLGQLGALAIEEITEHQMSYNDYYTLLQIVEAEATGGDEKSKILVANVVLNRVADKRFPDNVHDVVWEKVGGSAQFSPTEDGRIHSCEITNATIRAVNRAINGEDFSDGALFFAARASADSRNMSWFDSELVPLFAYGGHEFFAFREDQSETEE